MKLMKVIYNLRNMMNQEFQYSHKSQMSMKMKNSESIDDQQHQQENHFQSQTFLVLPPLKRHCMSLPERQNRRSIEQFLEFQLIEVMIFEIHLNQFESIVNLIQMKLMKVIDNLRNMMNQESQYSHKSQRLRKSKNSESTDDQQNQRENQFQS
jgi:hypothetical protein